MKTLDKIKLFKACGGSFSENLTITLLCLFGAVNVSFSVGVEDSNSVYAHYTMKKWHPFNLFATCNVTKFIPSTVVLDYDENGNIYIKEITA